MANRAVATMAVMVASDRVTAEQGMIGMMRRWRASVGGRRETGGGGGGGGCSLRTKTLRAEISRFLWAAAVLRSHHIFTHERKEKKYASVKFFAQNTHTHARKNAHETNTRNK